MRAAIYARCSTDENRQDVAIQLSELRRYCEAFGWAYDEHQEYDSAYKGTQQKLKTLLDQVRRKRYDVLLVYSLDRFSRQTPSKVNRLLDELVERDGCRFISRLEGIDSDNELTWNVVRRPLFAYFANVFSRNLSEKIKLGIKTQREKGTYRGGRPSKQLDVDRLRAIRLSHPAVGWRMLTKLYNDGLPDKQQVSFTLLRRVYQKLSFNGQHAARLN
jgi:DNA invertase Pin-like site-specific DNA recombinase